ncbi:Vacuolar ATPase [Pyrenophora tritici-repentis]|nr:Vacuolar ATPase [Pyrenophora tritici-repentis]KAG9383148.1 Vacuolar ATPase [Pyrenophora tritici-repentis]KAI0576430.1 Vacuolar ATPase [Pyrenophora tritici-repentis]KAI1530324.1 NtpF Archaeal vacuolar-type H+-ATPase subunit H [Pyrenophora tritici-repentis]KAI1569749.1 NtpF Archaeal vacuolar-type H+-ATPase subunit H [Pyrenophora tritici-repentis]
MAGRSLGRRCTIRQGHSLHHVSPQLYLDITNIPANPTPKMSAQNSAGIQTLLDAEREAQKIVQQAREYRTKRVKDARNEAQKEIEDYRKEKEDEYQKFEKEHSSGNQKAEEDAKKDTDAKVKEIEEIGNKSGSKVVDQLIQAVITANPEPPRKAN